jgi:hypothetical protein
MKAIKLRSLVFTLSTWALLVLPLLALAFQPIHAAKPWHMAPDRGGAFDLDSAQLAASTSPSSDSGHSAISSAPFQVIATEPEPNALGVSKTALISATFDGSVDPSTVSASTFPVWGAQTGRYAGAYSPPGSSSMQFDAAAPFKPGEVIVAAASSGIKDSGGSSLTPYLWQFTVAVSGGTGTLEPDRAYDVGDDPHSVAAADLDGDGDLDLAVANSSNHTDERIASVLLNQGDGTFAAQVTYDVGDGPLSVAAGDLDGDGGLDLAFTNWGLGTVSVLRNQGAGKFAAEVTYTAGYEPRSVAAGDLDGDGDLDLAVTNGDGKLSVLLNRGDGTFPAPVTYAAGAWPGSVQVGDLDDDGDLDLVFVNWFPSSSGTISVLLNQGNGTFAARVTYGVGGGPQSVEAGDLDGDGDLDLAVTNSEGGNISVLRNRGDGTFSAQVTYDVRSPAVVAAGDLDADGDLDLALANFDPGTVSVLLNRGDGTFANPVAYGAGNRPYSVATGDLDGDGDVDLAVTNVDDDSVSVLMGVAAPLVAPILSSPPDGSSTSDTTPAFQWAPVHGATSYQIQLDDDADFSSRLIDTTTSEASYTPDSALPLGTYYWRVKALSPSGDSAWSPRWRFARLSCGFLPLILSDHTVIATGKLAALTWETSSE